MELAEEQSAGVSGQLNIMLFRMMPISAYSAVILVLLLAGCENRAANAQRIADAYCRDHFCKGDSVPAHDHRTEVAFKASGQWFVGPSEYGGYEGSFEFFWPSRTPTHRADAQKSAPEFVPAGPGGVGNGSAVTIQLFVQSQPYDDTDVVEAAEREQRVVERLLVAPELERVRIVQHGYRTNKTFYYVAAQEKLPNGKSPVLYCDESHVDNGCSGYLPWKPEARIYVRFNQRYGRDWPAIYKETVRVLGLIRGA